MKDIEEYYTYAIDDNVDVFFSVLYGDRDVEITVFLPTAGDNSPYLKYELLDPDVEIFGEKLDNNFGRRTEIKCKANETSYYLANNKIFEFPSYYDFNRIKKEVLDIIEKTFNTIKGVYLHNKYMLQQDFSTTKLFTLKNKTVDGQEIRVYIKWDVFYHLLPKMWYIELSIFLPADEKSGHEKPIPELRYKNLLALEKKIFDVWDSVITEPVCIGNEWFYALENKAVYRVTGRDDVRKELEERTTKIIRVLNNLVKKNRSAMVER